MQQRDPGRSFVLGERLQYVLLPGLRTQDEAAEDPLTAVLAGQQADFELYWKNKLLRPLSEMFAVCLNPAHLHSLLSGLRPSPLLACIYALLHHHGFLKACSLGLNTQNHKLLLGGVMRFAHC